MALVYTSDELIEAVKDLGMVPEAQSLGTTDASILDHLTAVLQSQLALELMKIREEYYVFTARTTLTTATEYRIPSRAMGGKLRDVFLANSDGTREQIDPIQREDLHLYGTSTGLSGYFIEGNYIKLVGTPTAGEFLEMAYYMRPGDLVAVSEARQISTLNLVAKTVTFTTAVPTTWVTPTVDIHSPYSGAELKVWSYSATPDVPGTTLTFTGAIDGSAFGTHAVAVGDWVCLEGEAVVPALPREFHSVLVRGACLRLAEAQGDTQAVQFHGTLFKDDLRRALQVLESRIEGKPMRIRGNHALIWGC